MTRKMQNIHKINWWYLSQNPNAIPILEQNIHKMGRYTRYVLGDWKNNQGNAIKLKSEANNNSTPPNLSGTDLKIA